MGLGGDQVGAPLSVNTHLLDERTHYIITSYAPINPQTFQSKVGSKGGP